MKQVVLLRGVNVGGHNKLRMAELRKALTSFGFEDVATYIQSGNIVLRTPRPETLEEEVRQLLEREFGMQVSVIVRDHAQLVSAAERYPFSSPDTKLQHVGFLSAEPEPEAVAALDPDRGGQDRWAVEGRELFTFVPGGMARTKLSTAFFERLGVRVTVRNWRTLHKLIEMSAS